MNKLLFMIERVGANFFFFTFKKNFYCLSKKSFISLIALPGIILFTFNVIVLIFQFGEEF